MPEVCRMNCGASMNAGRGGTARRAPLARGIRKQGYFLRLDACVTQKLVAA